MVVNNAVILAAGRSQRFAPFTYEMPKGLFKVQGEVLVERQIQQLQEAGVKDIYIVVFVNIFLNNASRLLSKFWGNILQSLLHN